MKKAFGGLIVLFIGGICFAQTSDSYVRVNQMLRSGLNKNHAEIQQEAVNLDEAERLRLYSDYHMGSDDMWIGAGLDFFLGFGIGNFVQKDYLAGGIVLGVELAGGACMIAGAFTWYGALMGTFMGALFNANSTTDMANALSRAAALYITGGALFAGARIFGLVRTFVFPDIYNKKLRNALDVNGLVLNIEPALDMTERGVELALVRLRF